MNPDKRAELTRALNEVTRELERVENTQPDSAEAQRLRREQKELQRALKDVPEV